MSGSGKKYNGDFLCTQLWINGTLFFNVYLPRFHQLFHTFSNTILHITFSQTISNHPCISTTKASRSLDQTFELFATGLFKKMVGQIISEPFPSVVLKVRVFQSVCGCTSPGWRCHQWQKWVPQFVWIFLLIIDYSQRARGTLSLNKNTVSSDRIYFVHPRVVYVAQTWWQTDMIFSPPSVDN